MLTVLDAIQKSTDFLEKKGIDSARLNAELLLAEILNCKRLDLYLRFEKPLSDEETNKYRDWVARRGKSEPLQYIIGHVEFYGLCFNVNPAVLIPRQETEILVETVINQNNSREGLRILDIGTGSGVIPITLAKKLKSSRIISIDISPEAIEVAKENAILNGVEEGIELLNGDLFELQFQKESFDLIISNPPYVSKEEYQTLQKEIIYHEPREAISDDEDGLKFYRFITEKAGEWLSKNGKLYFEIGKDQYEVVSELLAKNNFKNVTIVKDYQQIERVIKGEKE